MQPAFRSIFRCHSLSPFVTLSAGRTTVASFACTFFDVDFAIYQRFGGPKSRAASGQSASRCSSTNSGSGDRLRHPSNDEIPMFLGNNRVGVFNLYKLKVQLFTEKKIEPITTFADRRLLPPRARGCSMSFVSADCQHGASALGLSRCSTRRLARSGGSRIHRRPTRT